MKLSFKPKLVTFCSSILFLSSCATILNSPVQKVYISSDKKIKVTSVDKVTSIDSSFKQINNKKAYYVPRSSKPLKVTLYSDSTNKTIFLKPKLSLAFWSNIYFNYGIGMLIDKDNLKRFSYPKWNYLELDNSVIERHSFSSIEKGTLNLSLTLPFTTIFNVESIDKPYKSAGIFGIEAGLDYFYQDNGYISLNIGAATDRFPAEYFGPGYIQTATVDYASLRNNNVVGRFDLGYGVNVSQLKWSQRTIGDTTKNDQLVKNTRLGLSLAADYRVGQYFRLGILYQPTFWNIDFKTGAPFIYQHYISLNLIWKLPIYRPD